MPFDNTIMLVELDRQGIDQLTAYLKKEGGQPIANAQFDYSATEPVMKLNDTKYQENNVYIITSDYLAGGGDDMTFLRDAEKKWDSGKLIRDVLIASVKKVDTLKAQQNTGRIILTP
jgi:2',3'-cyclic-nucleotide 2'-phosphodiesterase (5'-nucleotidase family)